MPIVIGRLICGHIFFMLLFPSSFCPLWNAGWQEGLLGLHLWLPVQGQRSWWWHQVCQSKDRGKFRAVSRIKNFLVRMGAGWETTLHVVAAILRMLRDPRMLPVCSSIMLVEYPVRTRLVNYSTTFRHGVVSRPDAATLKGTSRQFLWFHFKYCIRHIFCESNFLQIRTSRHFREWLNLRSRRRAMDAEISTYHSLIFSKQN